MILEFTSEAECDLEQIADYIAEHNPRRALEWEFRRGSEVVSICQSARPMVLDVETMVGACCEGAGIAQIMERGSQHIMESGKIVEIFPDWPDETLALCGIYPSRRQMLSAHASFYVAQL